jgi:hypothetical protein
MPPVGKERRGARGTWVPFILGGQIITKQVGKTDRLEWGICYGRSGRTVCSLLSPDNAMTIEDPHVTQEEERNHEGVGSR